MTREKMYQTVRDSLSDCYVDALDALAALEAGEPKAWDEREMKAVIEVAHKHGWNGVDNSKLLSVFLDQSLTTPPAPPAADCAIRIVQEVAERFDGNDEQFHAGYVSACEVIEARIRNFNAALAAPCECQRLREELEYWRLEFAKRIGIPIDDSGDNTHWACIAMGRIDVLEQQLMKNGYKSAIAEWEAELAQLRAELADAKSEIARLTAECEDHLRGIDMLNEQHDLCLDEIIRLDAELSQAVDTLRPFANVWDKRPPFDVTSPFRVDCEVGEYGAWHNTSTIVAAYDAKHGGKA